MEFHVYENARAACEAAGVLIAAQITRKGDSVLGLATGSTPIPAYEMLAQWYDRGVIDFDRVRTFNLDEYVGIDHKNPLSYHAFMQEHLFSKVILRKENVHLPSGNGALMVVASAWPAGLSSGAGSFSAVPVRSERSRRRVGAAFALLPFGIATPTVHGERPST